MKILLAVHHFPPNYSGGAEWRTLRTIKALQARGYQIRVVCIERIDAEPAYQDDEYDGIAVRRLWFNRATMSDPFRAEYDNPWIGEQVRQLIQEFQPQLLHLVSGYLISGRTLQVAHELGLPTVVSLTDFWFLCRRVNMLRTDGHLSTLPIDPARCARCLGEEQRRYRLPGRIAPALMDLFWSMRRSHVRRFEERAHFLRETLNQVGAIISPSQFLRKMFIESGVEPERIVYSRQGRDFPGLTPERLTKSAATQLRIGYLGQIAQHKGVHILVDAVRQLPEAALSLRIFGDLNAFPKYATQLQQLAAKDLRITLEGVRTQQEVLQLFRELDVVILPSIWYENSPNIILEAFAHRTPIIASNVGGMAELVQHDKNGLLFAMGDASDLARQLRRLLTEPELLSKLTTGIEPIRSVSSEMDELEQIYRRATQIVHST